MPKIVFDTNVWISAFLTPGGNGERAVRAVFEKRSELFTSVPLMTELANTLEKKFGWERGRVFDAVSLLSKTATL
jgi:putative PIN family toxin of toxin-antitoxin system